MHSQHHVPLVCKEFLQYLGEYINYLSETVQLKIIETFMPR